MDEAGRSDGVPLAAAAARLGMTTDTLRMRMKRKHYEGYKVGRKWYVVLPASESQATDNDRQSTEATDTPVQMIVGILHGQLLEKDKQLAEKDKQIAELHVLLQTAQQNEQRLLNAGVSVEMSTPPSAAPERPHEDEFPVESPETPHRGVQRVQRGLWQRFADALRGPS